MQIYTNIEINEQRKYNYIPQWEQLFNHKYFKNPHLLGLYGLIIFYYFAAKI